MFSIDSVTNSHLVNEGGKTVVETLDLILLLGSDNLDVGVGHDRVPISVECILGEGQ